MALVILGTIVAMALLVMFSRRVFEENRTRVVRRPAVTSQPVSATGDLRWRTLVDPAAAANRARASAPVAGAYARSMSPPDEWRAA